MFRWEIKECKITISRNINLIENDKTRNRGGIKMKYCLRILNLPAVFLLVSVFLITGIKPGLAQSGSATSTVTVSDATPVVGTQITATIYVDMSSVNSPDGTLGSFTGTISWDTDILGYNSNSGLSGVFSGGVVNTGSAGSGVITFNAASATGATGNISLLTITFDVDGEGNTSLDLDYSAMRATPTITDLLPILTIYDESVTASGGLPGEVTLDGAASSNTADDVSSIDISHTTGTGVNRLMLVGVSWNSNTSARTISSVTFTPDGGGALALSEVITQKHSDNYRYSAIYRLLNPPSGQAGTVTISFSGGTVTAGIVAGAVNFAGVDQTTPLGPSNGAYSPSNNTTVTVDLTGLNGDELVFDNVFLGGNPPAVLTVGAGQDQQWGTSYIANTRGAASTEQAETPSVTMSWTAAGSSMWVTTAVAINPAPAGPMHDLTIAVDPAEGGTTTPSAGIHSYAEDTEVEITAIPAEDYIFVNWSGDLSGSANPTTIVMDDAKSVTANFIPSPSGLDGAVSFNTANNVSSINITHTTGTGTNRLMLVGVSWNCGTTSRSVSSVTFGSYTLSNVITQLGENDSGDDRFSAIYSLINPPAGETGTVTITFSGSVSNGIVAGAVNVAGVDQTTPLGTPAGAALMSGTAPTITLNSLNGTELVFDNVFQGATNESQTLTAGAGQTENWNAFIGNTRAASSTEQAAGASVTMSWTAASESVWAIAAVPVNIIPMSIWLGDADTDWDNSSNWTGGVPDAGTGVIIVSSATNQPVISSTTNAECYDMTINEGATLTIESSPSSSGSLIVNGTSTGNVTYQRSIPDDGEPQLWHYVSSPVDPADITSDKDFYPWNEVPGEWGSITTNIETGRGYTIIGGGSVTYTGPVLTSDVTIDVTSPYRYDSFIDGTEVNYDSREFVQSGDGSHSGAVTRGLTNYGGGGWNLLGNPYTSALNVSDFIDENYSATPSASQFDPNYVAVFLYNGEGYDYIGNEVEGWGPGLSQTDIQAGQGFFVMAMNDNSSFTFTRDMQEPGTGVVLLKSARDRESWPGLNLTARCGDDVSSTLVVYNADMTAGLDPGYDVGLMSSGKDPEIYTSLVEDNSINFARQALPVTDLEKNIVAIGVNSKNGGNVIFSADVVPIKPYKYYLEDRLKGTFTDLGKDTYTVNLPANTYGTGRFYLHTSVGIRRAARPQKDNQGMSDLKIWSSDNSLIIEGSVSDEAVITVFNMQGRKIFMANLNDGMYNTITPPVRLKGVYLVEVRDGTKVYQAKVVFV
jgi:hypothetical protein